MMNRIILVLSIMIMTFSYLRAQNSENAHQLTQSCFITTTGELIINAGGQYTTAVSEQVFLRDSLHGSIFDTVSNTFKVSKTVTYVYDEGGLLTESSAKTLDKNGVSWINSQQNTYAYTGFQLHETTTRNWDKSGSVWTNTLQNKYSYESDNSLLSIFYFNWDPVSAQWDYSTKDLMAYDQNAKVISVSNQKWNKNLSSWENFLRINFTYSGAYITEKIYQVWNKSDQVWEDYQKESFTYAENKKSEIIVQMKSASTDWGNYSRFIYGYENSLLSNVTEYLWNDVWVNNRKYVYSYNTDNLETNVVIQQWVAHLSNFRNVSQDETFYSKHEVFGIDERPVNMIISNNPVSRHSGFSITGLKENTTYNLKLFSLNGSCLMNLPVTNGETVIPGNQIQTGIYLLSLTDKASKTIHQKIFITD